MDSMCAAAMVAEEGNSFRTAWRRKDYHTDVAVPSPATADVSALRTGNP